MPTAVLASAERFDLTSEINGHRYAVSLARPPAPPGEAPILIVLDAAFAFGTAVESAMVRAMMGQLEPAVVVGVGYDGGMTEVMHRRAKDLTPPAPADKYPDMAAMMGTDFGGADAFLSALLDEVVPAVRHRAPEASASRRILSGHSLGGLFAANALLTRPEAFETFLINSPSLWWNDFALPARLDGLAQTLRERGAHPRVLVTVASGEQDPPTFAPPGQTLEQARASVAQARMVDAARDFAEALKAFGLKALEFVCFDGEDHASVVPAGLARGITFALKREG